MVNIECSPENILEYIQRQNCGAKHHKKALLGLTVPWGQFLLRGQGDVCLNPRGHRTHSRVTLQKYRQITSYILSSFLK